MKKETKKKWNPPIILTTLPIKKTLGNIGTQGVDATPDGTAIYIS